MASKTHCDNCDKVCDKSPSDKIADVTVVLENLQFKSLIGKGVQLRVDFIKDERVYDGVQQRMDLCAGCQKDAIEKLLARLS